MARAPLQQVICAVWPSPAEIRLKLPASRYRGAKAPRCLGCLRPRRIAGRRGLQTVANSNGQIGQLQRKPTVRLASGQALEFILAVPGRRYNEFADLLAPFHESRCRLATEEVIGELAWDGLRLVVAHDPMRGAQQTQHRDDEIKALIDQAEQWAGKLDGQDEGVKHRGRKLSDSGAKARFFHAVSEAHLSRIIKVNLKTELFSYDIDESARALAQLIDGKLLLVTNTEDLNSREIVERYKSLADIERGFKVLKSELEIGPVYHRLPERIRAHAAICFMALILYRVIRTRLKSANAGVSPERALEYLRRIQHHRIRLNATEPVTGVSPVSAEQSEALNALNVKKPVLSDQIALL